MGKPQTESSAKSIYFAAIDIVDGKQRSDYVEQACGGNTELRVEVEQLLAARQRDCSNEFSHAVKQLNPTAEQLSAVGKQSVTATSDEIDASTHPVIGRYKKGTRRNRFWRNGHCLLGAADRTGQTSRGS